MGSKKEECQKLKLLNPNFSFLTPNLLFCTMANHNSTGALGEKMANHLAAEKRVCYPASKLAAQPLGSGCNSLHE